jgi:hypothetical protein
VTSAGAIASIGARTKNARDAPAGSVSSLSRFLSPSAAGWRSPQGPTRLGPLRSCTKPATRRSKSVMSAITTIKIVKTASTLAAEIRTKTVVDIGYR